MSNPFCLPDTIVLASAASFLSLPMKEPMVKEGSKSGPPYRYWYHYMVPSAQVAHSAIVPVLGA